MRIDAENGHRRVTRPRLRVVAKEMRDAGHSNGQRAIYDGHHPVRLSTAAGSSKSPDYERTTKRFVDNPTRKKGWKVPTCCPPASNA